VEFRDTLMHLISLMHSLAIQHLISLMHSLAIQHLRGDWDLHNLQSAHPTDLPPPVVSLFVSDLGEPRCLVAVKTWQLALHVKTNAWCVQCSSKIHSVCCAESVDRGAGAGWERPV